MANATIYIRDSDYELWQSIPDKSAWIRRKLHEPNLGNSLPNGTSITKKGLIKLLEQVLKEAEYIPE